MSLKHILILWCLVGLDQAVKIIFVAKFINSSGPFSLFWPARMPLGYITVAVLALLAVCMSRTQAPLARVSLLAIIAGGISNLADRFLRGGVIDVITIGALHTNIADCYIVIGIIGFMYYTLVFSPYSVLSPGQKN